MTNAPMHDNPRDVSEQGDWQTLHKRCQLAEAALADCQRVARYEGDLAGQSIAEVAKMKEEMMRAQRERDRADERAEHWHTQWSIGVEQYEALKQENLDLWTELELARKMLRGEAK